MLNLSDLAKGQYLLGLEPDDAVRVVSVDPLGEAAVTLVYRTASGALGERLLTRADLSSITLAQAGAGLPWSFDAQGEDFKLACEAIRIDLAHLFDPMMAVHTANVEPLPHQITAVYDAMLPRQPLRFVLADDPGAGKTVMAGLYIRELVLRADARRVLIVAPGSLVEQWQDELHEKFGLDFAIFSREKAEQSPGGNLFADVDFLIARIDQLARAEDLQDKLRAAQWDLVVVDEAHKLAAHYYGNKIERTRRFELGELLGASTRHFLLMTATPHNGKDEDFQLFLSLLDADRFYGKARDGAHKVEVADLMRRMVKEDLLRFDGTRLFPERRATTVSYALSPAEAALYEAVTRYVKEEMNRADRLDDKRRTGTVGFALTGLQRRLASSPQAIHESLRRRHRKLKLRLDEARREQRTDVRDADFEFPEDEDELTAEEYERDEARVVDQATAARTVIELETEIATLAALEKQALAVRHCGQDCKWTELSRLLQDTPEMRDAARRQQKLIVFTEHRDTLDYLAERIRTLLGAPEAVVLIHGGVKREERRKAQELFRNDAAVRVLIATDAAGEGVNLQNAHLMVNYDLPWNPNRLEQRFGRIHRIGQTEVCHLWNMVAQGTREGEVFLRLFEKLEQERAALGGRVFDILGEVFEDKSLKELLIEAIRHGDDPAVRARQQEKIDGALDHEHLQRLMHRDMLCEETMNAEALFKVKAELEQAEARKLQPYFVQAFFRQAFARLGGELRPREKGRWEIPHVPADIRERDRQIAGRDRRYLQPVTRKYERVCFEKAYLRDAERPNSPLATLLHPAHPLMQAVTDLTREATRTALRQGALLLDPDNASAAPYLLFMLEHRVKEGDGEGAAASGGVGRDVSRRVWFVAIDETGQARPAGWAPHLDLSPLPPQARASVAGLLTAPWLQQDLSALALGEAAAHFAPGHFAEVAGRRAAQVDKTLKAVHERLVKAIHYWEDRYDKLKDDLAAGKDARLPAEEARKRREDLQARLKQRTAELQAMRRLVSAPPTVLGGALVIPQGWLQARAASAKEMPDAPVSAVDFSADAAVRARTEQLAMQTVIAAERALGHAVENVSALKCGWDLTSQPPAVDGKLPPARHIEVKGRVQGADTVTFTRSEILYALNQAEKFWAAIVLVDPQDDTACTGPFYVHRPFTKEPDDSLTSSNHKLADLLARAVSPTESRS